MFIFAVFFIILYRKITVEFFYLQYREVGNLGEGLHQQQKLVYYE